MPSRESIAFDNKVRANFTRQQYDYIVSHFDDFKGAWSEPTDEKRLGKIAEKLFIRRVGSPADGVALAEKIKRFSKDTGSLEERAAHLGFTGKDAVKDFKDAYFSKDTPKSTRDQWYTLLHDRYGKGAYEKTVKDLRKLENDEMNSKIARDRETIMEGYDPETGKLIPKYWAESAFMGIFQPRQKQAFIEGRDPTVPEILMDSGSNAALVNPVGAIERGIAKYAVGPVSKGLSKYVVPVFTNSLAPSAVALGDYIFGTKQYANAEDAAIDAGLGLATNLMANKGVAALGSRLLGGATASAGTDKGIRKTLAQMLDGTLTEREAAQQKVREATSRAKSVLSSKKPLSGPDEEQLLDDLIVAEYGRMMRQDKVTKKNLGANIVATNYSLSEKTPGDWKQIGKKPLSELELVNSLEGTYVTGMPKDVVNDPSLKNLGRLNREQLLESKVSGPDNATKVQNPLPKPNVNLGTFIRETLKSPEGKEYIIREALRNHPELEILAAPADKKAMRKDDVRRALTAIKNFSVNKFGSDSDASRIVNVLPGIDLQGLRKYQQEMREEARKKAMEKSIGGKK